MDHEHCPWPGCKNKPELHAANLGQNRVVYWVFCDTSVTQDNRIHRGGHVVVGPEADNPEEAWERWDSRMLTDLGEPKKHSR